jgi:aminoglycoside phosphotransferase (APT) family kinase protein
VPAPALTNEDVQAFLEARYGEVSGVERLEGGFWSAAYGFRTSDRELVARFGTERSWFEADRAAMAFAGPDLPVPEVLDVGDGPGGVFAVSVRHHGVYLESIDPERSSAAGPMLGRLFEALYRVPKSADLAVGWHWEQPGGDWTWRDWLLDALVDDPGRFVHGWRAKLAAEPELDRLLRACEARITYLVEACPERRDLVHGDLLHGNVLVSTDARSVTAVFSWKCSVRGDFVYDVAWCTFWGGLYPGIAAADPWGRVLSSEVILAEPQALVDVAERHHCYELQIGATHLAWNVRVGDAAALSENARLLSMVLERGPSSTPAAPARPSRLGDDNARA